MKSTGAKEAPPPAAPAPDPAAALAARARALEEERDRLKDELGDVRERFLRARADYENLVRRSGRDVQDSVRAAKGALLLRFIAVSETLEKSAAELDRAAPDHAKGVRLVLDELRRLLKDEGVKEIESLGQSFNYRFHQAVESVESADRPEGTILDVIQRGYLHHNEILRPALVRVAAPPKRPPPKDEAKAGA